MNEIHWSVWVSLSIAFIIITWLVRPPPEQKRFRPFDKHEIRGVNALGIAFVLGSVGLALWVVYYLVKMVFWN